MGAETRILILEDNPADAELATYTLKSAGLRFISKLVQTEEDFRKGITAFSPHIIISDYELPEFNGVDALRIAREFRPDVPFILMTGAGGEERAIEILTSGATDYVMKNHLSRLVPAVERALKEAEELKKRQEAEAQRDLLFKESESKVRERTAELQAEIERRKSAERKLEWLASFPEQNPNPVLELEPDCRTFSYLNLAGRRLFPDLESKGLEHALLAGLPSLMEESPSNRPASFQREIQIEDKFYAQTVCRIPENGRIRVYAIDVTERKRSEARMSADLIALTRMHELSGKILESKGLQPLLQEIMDAAVAIMGAEQGTLQLLESNSLRIVAHHGHKQPFLEFFASAENRPMACEEALSRGQRLIVPDVETSDLFAGTPSLPVLLDAGVRAMQSTPLISRSGKMLGILTTQWGFPYNPDEQNLWRIDLLARQAADLIKHFQAEEELRKSKALLDRAEEIAGIGSWEWKIQSGELIWSEQVFRLFGLEPGRFAPTPEKFMKHVHPDFWEAVSNTIEHALSNTKPFNIEYQIIMPGSETTRWLFAQGVPAFDNERKPVSMTGTVQDVTDRKRVENDLKQAMHLGAALNTISTALYSNLDTGEILKILVEEGAKALECESAGISLLKGDLWTVSYVYGFPESFVGAMMTNDEEPHGVLALRTREPVLIRDAFNDKRVNPEHMRKHNIRSVLVMPLIVMNEPIGVLFLNNRASPTPFNDSHIDFARQLATTAAIALKNSRLVEELSNLIAALEESERYLKLAITSAEIGIYDINLITQERKWDDQIMKLWGLPPGYPASEETFLSGVHPDDLARMKTAYRLANDPRGSGRFKHEYRVRGIQDGIERWISMHGQIYFQNGRAVRLLGTALDITDKKNNELALRKSRSELEERVRERTRELSNMAEELRKSEEAYRLLVELNPVGVFRHVYDPVSRKTKRLHCNEAQLRLLGYSSLDEYLKDNPPDIMRSKGDWNLYIGLLVSEGKVVNFPVQMIQKDGNTIWVLLNATARADGERLIIEGAMTDISAQKRTEERLRTARKQLRAMASEIVMADERSRQHFATDLHDTVVQTLGAAKLRAQLIQDQIPQKAQPMFTELQDMVSQSITQSRLIMSEMSPPVLYELGFIPALEWLTEQIQGRHNLAIDFKTSGRARPLIHELQILLFQATRELLMNVVKHARAGTINVKVSSFSEKVRIEVKDDGKGFDKRQAFRSDIRSGGFGLFSIRERLRHFGGHLFIRSKPGKGTAVVMIAPRSTP